MTKTKYRDDISGLRALAIIPVVLFHLGVENLKGGYVGVDVFFAISGFLITTILLKQITTGSFSFIEFFTRRIRRLAPALLVMYLGIIISFSFIYPTFLFKDIITSIGFSMAFISNIFFWNKGGYFSNDIELQPLLHTWSLSIEEQFYLFLPLLLLIVYKLTKSNKWLFIVLLSSTLISLFLAIYMAPPRGSFAAFYLLPTRVYELGTGCLLALLLHLNPDMKLRQLKFIKELGLLCIIIPVFFYSKATPFPSFYALLPVIGACLVIFSNQKKGIAYKLFTLPPIIYIGVISYSLYLWHWPVIVFMKWALFELNSVVEHLVALTASLMLASISYHFVETPFRSSKSFSDYKIRALYLITTLIMVLVLAFLFVVGNQKMVDPDLTYESTYFKAIEPEHVRKKCADKARARGKLEVCSLNDNVVAKSRKIFVWGDSHASALMPAFDDISENIDVDFSLTTGCIPLTGIYRTDLPQNCRMINDKIFEHILNNDYDLIILSAAYNNYLNWGVIGEKDYSHTRNEQKAVLAFTKQTKMMLSQMSEADIHFLIVAQPPRFRVDIPFDYLKQSIMNNQYDLVSISLSEYNKQKEAFYRSIPKEYLANILDLTDVFCSQDSCSSISGNGDFLYKDHHHISNYLAEELSRGISQRINEVTLKKVRY